MDLNNLCEHRHHTPGKGNKRCTNFAVHEVYIQTATGKEFRKLCGKHYDDLMTHNPMIYQHSFIPTQELCPECGSALDFSKGVPLCTGNHPISGKTQRYLKERYPEYFQTQTLEVQGEMK